MDLKKVLKHSCCRHCNLSPQIITDDKQLGLIAHSFWSSINKAGEIPWDDLHDQCDPVDCHGNQQPVKRFQF